MIDLDIDLLARDQHPHVRDDGLTPRINIRLGLLPARTGERFHRVQIAEIQGRMERPETRGWRPLGLPNCQ